MRLIKDSILNLAFLLTILHGLLVHTHGAEQSLYQVNAVEHQHVDFACFAKHIVDRDLGGDHLENFTSTDDTRLNILQQTFLFAEAQNVFLTGGSFIGPNIEQVKTDINARLEAQGCLNQFSFRGPPFLS